MSILSRRTNKPNGSDRVLSIIRRQLEAAAWRLRWDYTGYRNGT